MGGRVWVYLPQSYTNQIFALGSKYQQELVTKDRAIELATIITDEITSNLELDHPIRPLQFLVSDEEEEHAEDLDLNENDTDDDTDDDSEGDTQET